MLHERIVGQDEAVTAVAKAMGKHSGCVSQLKDPKRPMGSLLIPIQQLGKTKDVAKPWQRPLGDEKSMIRFDMSLHGEHTVYHLVGSLPGYVGYDEGGGLTDQVRSKPYSVVPL